LDVCTTSRLGKSCCSNFEGTVLPLLTVVGELTNMFSGFSLLV
jgi:hypothetical protein